MICQGAPEQRSRALGGAVGFACQVADRVIRQMPLHQITRAKTAVYLGYLVSHQLLAREGNDVSPLSGPPFIELSSCCSFHLPARPTSPLNLRCRQVLVSERFSLMFLGAKPDGASRSRVHIDLPIWINPVLQGDPHWKLFLLPIPIDKYFNRMATQYEAVMQASKD